MYNNPLHNKIDEFISKYYTDKLIRGLIYFGALILSFFLLFGVVEYLGRLGTTGRTILFFSYILISIFLLIFYVIIPILKIKRIGKTLSYHHASALIGSHFPSIKDKLLNTLQLTELNVGEDNSLLTAAINQKIQSFKPISFKNAINLNLNLKYLKYIAVPFLMLLIIMVFQSSIITKSVNRIVKYNTDFIPPPPFVFKYDANNLNVARNTDFAIRVNTEGNVVPDEVFVNVNGQAIRMDVSKSGEFNYVLRSVKKGKTFFFESGDYRSDEYTLNVIANPKITGYQATTRVPNYTGINNEQFNFAGNITVPQGSSINWKIIGKDAQRIGLKIGTNTLIEKDTKPALFSKRFYKNNTFTFYAFNPASKSIDSIQYKIDVIPDKYPKINVEVLRDSFNENHLYFVGTAQDDYGLNKLTFNYKIGANGVWKSKQLPVKDKAYTYSNDIDFNSLGLKQGETAKYYFEVWDNDGVNGNKSVKTDIESISKKSEIALKKDIEKTSNALASKMEQAIQMAAEIQKQTSAMNKKLLENKPLDWQQKKKLDELLQKKKNLKKLLKEIERENKIKQKKEDKLSKPNEKLKEKKDELKKLLKELKNNKEMEKMLKKLEELMKKMDKKALKKHFEKMEKGQKNQKMNLERIKEQYKRLEVENLAQEAIKELEKMAKKQRELKAKLDNAKTKEEKAAIKKEQDKLNEEFKQLEKRLEEMKKKNEDLKSPMDLKTPKEKTEDIKSDMKKASESMAKGKSKKAGKSQKSAADKMEEMMKNLDKQLKEQQQKDEGEDYNTLRAILENLIQLSYNQEEVLSEIKLVNASNPKFIELRRKQSRIKEDSKMVEDSLVALAQRNVFLKTFITEKIGDINTNMDRSIDYLNDRRINLGRVHQQYVMTGMNDLAVMLSETLKQMQQKMNSKKKKSGKACKNPNKKGKGKPSDKMGKMKKGQKQIGKMLGKMKGGKKGQKMSKALAKIAAQQSMLRKKMEELSKELDKKGAGKKPGGMKKTEKMMEKQIKDVVNRNITPETLKRQREIESRMLEHEKAIREQEMENKRQGETAQEVKTKTPPSIQKYIDEKKKQTETLQRVSPKLKPFYKKTVGDYFKK